jgi:hypothetical protein
MGSWMKWWCIEMTFSLDNTITIFTLLRRNRMVHTQAGKHSYLAKVTPAPVVTMSVSQTANFFLYPKKPLGRLY